MKVRYNVEVKCAIFCKIKTNSNVWPAYVQMWPVEFTLSVHIKLEEMYHVTRHGKVEEQQQNVLEGMV
jgi:hypothetical protein